jgi:putative inorganic carbon (hco3(-)) transporter
MIAAAPARVVVAHADWRPAAAPALARHQQPATTALAFGLFLVLTAILWIRPTEIVESLDGLPMFQAAILVCLIAAVPAVLDQLDPRHLAGRPITACVYILAVAVPLSNLDRPADALSGGFEFWKVVAYYVLLVAIVDTPRRLQGLLAAVVACLVIHGGLAVLNFHEVIDLPAMKPSMEYQIDPETGKEAGLFPRMAGVGFFGNPNDLSRILVVGAALSVYFLRESPRLFWPVLVSMAAGFVYALTLTYSRGGLLALMATGVILWQILFGGWRSAVLGAVAAMVVLAVAGGSRLTDLSTGAGTGQQRIQLWLEGFEALWESPLLGIGADRYPDVTGGLAAHNSFVQAYIETGMVGGTAFTAAVLLAVWGTFRLGPKRVASLPSSLNRMRPFVIAIVAGYAVGMMSSTRNYVTPTYMLIGVAAAYQQLIGRSAPQFGLRVNARLAVGLTVLSAAMLAVLYLFARLSVRWAA